MASEGGESHGRRRGQERRKEGGSNTRLKGKKEMKKGRETWEEKS